MGGNYDDCRVKAIGQKKSPLLEKAGGI